MGDIGGKRARDAGLHGLEAEARRVALVVLGGRRRQGQPRHVVLRTSRAAPAIASVVTELPRLDAPAPHIGKQVLREASQHMFLVEGHGTRAIIALREQLAQAGHRMQRAQADIGRVRAALGIGLTRRFGEAAGLGIEVALVALLQHQVGQALVIMTVGRGRAGVGEEETSDHFMVTHPGDVIGKARQARERVVIAVAEDQVEHRTHGLPDEAHIGFPSAVDRDIEQQLRRGGRIGGRQNREAEKMHGAKTRHRIGKRTRLQRRFATGLADAVQHLQHAPQAVDIGEGIERPGTAPCLMRATTVRSVTPCNWVLR